MRAHCGKATGSREIGMGLQPCPTKNFDFRFQIQKVVGDRHVLYDLRGLNKK